jgi:hypothetical protein
MGKIDDAIQTLVHIPSGTERALQLAGLISTLFKLKGVVLIATNELAYDVYADAESDAPEVELAAFAGTLTPRIVLEVMRGQLYAFGSIYHWTVAGIPVRLTHDTSIVNRNLCRDFTTDMGVVKLMPVEEITADFILAAVYPVPDIQAQTRARRLLVNGLTEIFEMNWPVLHALCHRPEYRVGEELAQMRLTAKRDVDALGTARDHIGETTALPRVDLAAKPVSPAPEMPENVVDFIPAEKGSVNDEIPAS